ncbi:ATP-binding protein [Cupriavidus taiwanensis]|uniref:ATP-binding protein n=1 Tax=Cupriavidus taiwanensis TaxID=164546 RepID=UPI0022B2513E|nr:ATP-binding protein [Cupriavidus taiwanensis]
MILIRKTSLGKSWLAYALANQACRHGYSVGYLRMPKFREEMAMVHGSGRFGTLLAQWAKTDILVVDDFATTPLADQARLDLLGLLDVQHGSRSTVVTSQIPAPG